MSSFLPFYWLPAWPAVVWPDVVFLLLLVSLTTPYAQKQSGHLKQVTCGFWPCHSLFSQLWSVFFLVSSLLSSASGFHFSNCTLHHVTTSPVVLAHCLQHFLWLQIFAVTSTGFTFVTLLEKAVSWFPLPALAATALSGPLHCQDSADHLAYLSDFGPSEFWVSFPLWTVLAAARLLPVPTACMMDLLGLLIALIFFQPLPAKLFLLFLPCQFNTSSCL